MEKWIECIPNFSEGRRREIIENIVEQIRAVANTHVLGYEMDPDHNRAVVTFVSSPQSVCEAAFKSIAKASQLIDIQGHTGEHPRMGATDVCPLVPLQNVDMEECVHLAQQLGKRVGEELHIPVFLYEYAATIPERRNLANIRRGEFEKIREYIGKDLLHTPDFGPKEMHPTAGSIAIGARFFLIAYNVNLATDDIAVAKKIAKAIREKDGGLPGIKALGFSLTQRQMTQVSMNITDYRKTSPKTALDEIVRHATQEKAEVVASELVGFIPIAAVEQNIRETLRINDFTPDKILEYRLLQTMHDPLELTKPFLEAVASVSPTPGGGSCCAFAGTLATALARKVAQITSRNKKYQAISPSILSELQECQSNLHHLVQEDSEAYASFIVAKKMPQDTEEATEARRKAIDRGIMRSILIPVDTMTQGEKLLARLLELTEKGNPNLISDIGTACHMASAAVEGAALNVRINLKSIEDDEFKRGVVREIDDILYRTHCLRDKVLERVNAVMAQ